jgi:hypothetical protein
MQLQQEVDIFVVTDPECEEVHISAELHPYPSNICAGVPEGGKGQCSVIIIEIMSFAYPLLDISEI